MRKAVVCCVALLAAGAVRPVVAGNVYIPIIEKAGANGATYDTEVWVSNGGQVERSFVTTFLTANSDGTKRTGVVSNARVRIGSNGTFRLGNAAPASQHGLLEVDAAPQLQIGARVAATKPNAAGLSFASLPVISSENMIAANETAELLGLERQGDRVSDVSVVNLAKAATQCEIALFRANGSQITAATVTLQPLSLRRFADALAGQNGTTDARARVQCNRSFYAFATLTDITNARVSFAAPSASGTSSLTGPSGGTTTPPPTPGPTPSAGSLVYEIPGHVLTPGRGTEVREAHYVTGKNLSLKRMLIELDFTVGPWSTREKSGPHAIIWLYRGKFRSNTIANVNVHGPTKDKIRMNQNIDLPGLSDTLAQAFYKFEIGHTYHFFYNYNAETNRVICRVSEGSNVVASLDFAGSASKRILSMPATGFDVVFGHRAGLGYEVPSYGWTYSNFRATLVPY